ncbi:2'-5' RNA ligase superfamily-domain-containing protein [Alternaria alternata]|nr:2'-5' RNA ligase superfamily-domain-containing protein [Alternaria alternata]
MAKSLPAHLTYKTALVLLPPSSIAAPIDRVRGTYDKHFKRWPAHINLLYPFLSEPSEPSGHGNGSQSSLKPDIRARIISLEADPPGVFHHGPNSKTVWLGPTTQSVQQLHAALQKEFPEVNADRRPFTPHLSVGQAKSQALLPSKKPYL